MSDVNQFGAFIVPSSLVGDTSSFSNTSLPYMPNTQEQRAAYNLMETRCGALTSNTYKTLLTVSGRGVVNFVGFFSLNSGIYTYGIKVTIDGIVIERTGEPNSGFTDKGFPVVGGVTQDLANNIASSARFDPVPFNTSFVVEIKSTQTITDGLAILTNYRTFP